MAVACGPSDRNDNFGTGDGGGSGGGGGGGGGGGSGNDGCSDASKLIYVVDVNNKLAQFNPSTKTFNDLGTLSCPTPPPVNNNAYQPFSMGVDRNAQAYVLYASQDSNNGNVLGSKLFKVDTTQAGLPCTATTFSDASMLVFGMGFSTTTAGGDTDELFIAGGTSVATGSSQENLHKLDVTSYALSGTGKVTGSPELTGNANAELWGFFPDESSTGGQGARIEKIDKTSGTAASTAMLTDTGFSGQPLKWAFGFYGGDYWVFLEKDPSSDILGTNPETHTTVYEVSPTGQLMSKTAATGREIVGAGVSTCAPVVISRQ